MLYGKYVLMCLKSQMQYRVSFFLVVLGQFLAAFASYLGVTFMFTRFHAVDEFTYEQVLLCYGVVLAAFSLAELLAGGFSKMGGVLANGEFDRILVRPRSVILQMMFGKVDFARIGLLIQAILVFVLAISTDVVCWTFDKILTLILMIAGGTAVFSGLFLINGTCVIFTLEGEFMNIFTYGGREFGRYPFSIYGRQILCLLTYGIPMAWFQYYPLRYLLGMDNNKLLILSPLIGALFLVPSYLFFRFGLRKYKSTGS